ncbi:hypothetical protein H2203_006411 [Taxawa tesnikishii (nom. ined.)]|nr:hypothetical protein H2203_006411 [Dothideales sp. JES 119]
MTTAIYRSTPSLAIPPSQNTAPVLEFNCLYTHDIRRKQKRWQDGFLRYHTFNKRIMLYDVPRNFVGDTHWTSGEELQEGDEVTLEKSGVMVQVADSVGRTETDLSELLRRKDKDRSSPTRAPSSPAPRTVPRPAQSSAAGPQLRHKSLNALLGTSRGPIGKSMLPTKSPFELRGQENGNWEEGRTPKRQKTQDWNVTRTTTTLKPRREDPLWARTADSRQQTGKASAGNAAKTLANQGKLVVKEVIDLLSDTEEIAEEHAQNAPIEEAVPPSSPLRVSEKTPAVPTSIRRSSPAFQTQDTPAPLRVRKEAVAAVPKRTIVTNKPRSLDRRTSEARKSPPVSTSNKITVTQPSGLAPAEPAASVVDVTSPSIKRGAALRLASSTPRKMLICESQLPRTSSGGRTANVVKRRPSAKTEAQAPSESEAPKTQELNPHRKRLQERLAQIGKKKRSLLHSSQDDLGADALDMPPSPRPPGVLDSRHVVVRNEASPTPEPDPFEDMAFDYGRMDQQLMNATIAEPAERDPAPAEPTGKEQQRPSRRVISETSSEQTNPPQRRSIPPTKSATEDVAGLVTTKPFKRLKANQKSTAKLDLLSGADPVTSTLLAKPFKAPSMAAQKDSPPPPKDTDLGPWSKEAFDLMDWRPPDRDANGLKIVSGLADQ